ncbi:MAG: hypothetical protein ABI698_11150 [bacterium]
MKRIAAAFGAKVYLGANEKLKLGWTSMDGQTNKLELPLAGHPNSRYELYIGNTPSLQVGKMVHSDFQKYYLALNVPFPEWYDLKFTSVGGGFDLMASVDAPCMPGNHGG